MVKLVDTYALGAYAVMRVGSSPTTPTLKVTNMKKILCALLLQVQKSKAFAHRCERRSQIQFDSVTSTKVLYD